MKNEQHIAAFCNVEAPEVFHAIEHRNDIYKSDPFDVAEVNGSARELFGRLLQRHSGKRAFQSGSILLLKGRAGSGKTHMMRAYRNTLHGENRGYFGYLQLTTRSDNYVRYLLRGFIHSLEQPYCDRTDRRTGLRRLAETLAGASQFLEKRFPDRNDISALEALQGEHLSSAGLAKLIAVAAPHVAREPSLEGLHKDFVQALLCLLTEDPRLQGLAVQFLRTDPYSAEEASLLGGLMPRSSDDDALWMFEQFGMLMSALDRQTLVLGVDQLEDVYTLENTESVFRRAVTALRAISDAVPNSVLVLACLEDYYTELRRYCAQSLLDRIERDPEPVVLSSKLDGDTLGSLIGRRLEVLYGHQGLALPEVPVFPFTADVLQKMHGTNLRDALDYCRRWQETCMESGALTPLPDPGKSASGESVRDGAEQAAPYATSNPDIVAIEQAWNEHHTEWSRNPPSRSEELGPLLAAGLQYCSEEMPRLDGLRVRHDGPEVTAELGDGRRAAVVCNRTVNFGWLKKEMDQAAARHAPRELVLVRAAPFRSGSGSDTARRIAELETAGVAFRVISNAEWRDVEAMAAFREHHAGKPAFGQWLRAMRPLTKLSGFRELLGLDADQPAAIQAPTPSAAVTEIRTPPPSTETVKPGTPESPAPSHDPPAAATPPKATPRPAGETACGRRPVELGTALGAGRQPVTIDPEVLTQHGAFLGGSGCGKTTLAMRLVEGLLFRGIPAVLLDRKGDLVNYAQLALDGGGAAPDADPGAVETLARIAEISLYTPGHPDGHPIGLGLMPESMDGLTGFELEQMATDSAASLCAMMAYTERREDQAGRSLLKAALHTLAERGEGAPTLDRLIDHVAHRDAALVETAGNLKPRSFDKLVQDLEVLRIGKSALFGGEGEPLDPARFFAPPADPRRKARLTILSTQFLGAETDIEFWVAQWLLRLGRYIGQAPAPELRGVVFFDEADRYLPAQRNPATKGPLENLLRRARSAGLGILLASQSPGDFDYKCRENVRTWFIGRIKEDTALRKMKPLLSQFGDQAMNKLPGQSTGQFILADPDRQTAFAAAPCLVAPVQQPLDTTLDLARRLGNRQAG